MSPTGSTIDATSGKIQEYSTVSVDPSILDYLETTEDVTQEDEDGIEDEDVIDPSTDTNDLTDEANTDDPDMVEGQGESAPVTSLHERHFCFACNQIKNLEVDTIVVGKDIEEINWEVIESCTDSKYTDKMICYVQVINPHKIKPGLYYALLLLWPGCIWDYLDKINKYMEATTNMYKRISGKIPIKKKLVLR